MTIYFDRVLAVLNRWEPLGVVTPGLGCRLIGHVPHVAPQAYLHRLFGPLSDPDIDLLESQTERALPHSLRAFYACSNGLNLFSSALIVYGLRSSWNRADVRAMLCQPFDARTPNLWERPLHYPSDAVVISTYQDRTFVAVHGDGTVDRSVRDGSVRLNRWASIGDWLESEVLRLADLFDDFGRCSIPLEETAPPPARPR
jgi:hypothetical protein